MTSNPAEILTTAAQLIRTGHTKGNYAINNAGEAVSTRDDSAVCFCLMGALYRANHIHTGFEVFGAELFGPVYAQARDMGVSDKSGDIDVAIWNDLPDTTAEQVVQLLEGAARRVEVTA